MSRRFFRNLFICPLITAICLSLSSCASLGPFTRGQAIDISITDSESKEAGKFYKEMKKNIRHLGNRGLSKTDNSFWQDADSVAVFLFDHKEFPVYVRGDVNAFETVKTGVLAPIIGVLGPARNEDVVFEKKAEELFSSYKSEVNQYLLSQFSRQINVPQSKNEFLAEGIRYFAAIDPQAKEMILSNPSDRYIFLNLRLGMAGQYSGEAPSFWKEPKVNLKGILIMLVGKDKLIQEFIQKNEYLPLYPGPEVFMGTFGPRASSIELRQFRNYPGIYLGSVSKKTEFYSKKEWVSENGAFMERKLKSLIDDLIQEAHNLLFQ